MSTTMLMSNINRVQKEIADLNKKISDEKKKESQASSKINTIQRSITRSTSASTLNSKLGQINRLNDDIAKYISKQAELSKKLAAKTADLHKYQQQLAKEQERERKKQEDLQKKLEREQLDYHRALTRELEEQKRLVEEVSLRTVSIGKNNAPAAINDEDEVSYDFFISHASEDKEDFVRPLADELTRLGVKVWYDEFSLKIGDSLRRSIDKGLANSRFGVVVISSSFIKKNWTQYELDGMVAREMDGMKVILPIWHKVTKSEVMKYSPTLADKYALNSSMNEISEIAEKLKEVLE